MIQNYDFAGTRLVNAAGQFFKYMAGNAAGADNTVVLRVDGVTVGKYMPGDAIKLPDVHKTWSIEPVTPTCIGSVAIGYGDITSASLQGIVQIVDGGKARSVAGGAFSGYSYKPQTVSNYAQVQLWNNSAGNKNIVINSMGFLSSAAGGVQLNMASVALATLVQNGLSKRAGSAASLAGEMRTTAAAATPAGVLRTWLLVANTSIDYRPTEPWVIPPGFGLIATNTAVSTDLGASFEWFEEAV